MDYAVFFVFVNRRPFTAFPAEKLNTNLTFRRFMQDLVPATLGLMGIDLAVTPIFQMELDARI